MIVRGHNGIELFFDAEAPEVLQGRRGQSRIQIVGALLDEIEVGCEERRPLASPRYGRSMCAKVEVGGNERGN